MTKKNKYLSQAEASGSRIVTAVTTAFSKNNFIVVDNPYLAFATLDPYLKIKLSKGQFLQLPKSIPQPSLLMMPSIGHYVVIAKTVWWAAIPLFRPIPLLMIRSWKLARTVLLMHMSPLQGLPLRTVFVSMPIQQIGSEGFGFAPYQGKWHRIAQLGSVQIGNDACLGSNCSIDRGALDDTILEDGVIIDNLVQIAHNVQIGQHTAIAANTAIAGSVRIGKNCIIGGGSAVAGHLNIADNVTLTGMSMVTKSISEAGTFSSGIGLFENSHWKRTVVRLRQLADVPLTQITKRLDHMQAQLESLESTLKLRK
ncbi:MAG: UDP-3-O-(3-hydroxymyristoyl)glucosamine N-acyltransferase [Acinetobacter sp.]